MYNDNFFFISNTMATLKVLKTSLVNENNIKDYGDIKRMIGWQIYQELTLI